MAGQVTKVRPGIEGTNGTIDSSRLGKQCKGPVTPQHHACSLSPSDFYWGYCANVCPAAAKMSRPPSTASTATATTMSGHARTASVKTIPKPQAVNLIPVSDVRLFVTNLRLLDFDLRPDWPGITIQTFSAKNADQRQRIGGTEWALFRLFEIWDPSETAQVGWDEMPHGRVTDRAAETSTLLPTTRTTPILEPSRCAIPMSERTEEEWGLGKRVGS
jgi:hypothetical protein